MCFGGTPEAPKPAPPAEVLKQEAPEKKTANRRDAQALSIGTKRYRRESGLGTTSAPVRPTGPAPSS